MANARFYSSLPLHMKHQPWKHGAVFELFSFEGWYGGLFKIIPAVYNIFPNFRMAIAIRETHYFGQLVPQVSAFHGQPPCFSWFATRFFHIFHGKNHQYVHVFFPQTIICFHISCRSSDEISLSSSFRNSTMDRLSRPATRRANKIGIVVLWHKCSK